MELKLFGIPVRIHPFFAVIAVLLGVMWAGEEPGWIERLMLVAVIVLVGILAHELGHAFAGKVFGLSPRIVLHGMGGLTTWDGGRALSPGRSIVVSFAGPLVGIVVGICALVVGMFVGLPHGTLGSFALEVVVGVNLGWGILNLIPMMPLDGGNIMASFFAMFSPRRGRLVARWISLGLAALIFVWAISEQEIFLIVILASLALSNFRALRVETKLGADLPLAADLLQIRSALEKGEVQGAARQAEELLSKATSPVLKAEANNLLAWARYLEGDVQAARTALDAVPEKQRDAALDGATLLDAGLALEAIAPLEAAMAAGAGPFVETRLAAALVKTRRFDRAIEVFGSLTGRKASPDVLQALEEAAHRAGEFQAASRLGEILFEREGTPLRAFNIACSFARARQPDRALDWLRRARDAGFDQVELLDGDGDLTEVRNLPDWQAFRRTFFELH